MGSRSYPYLDKYNRICKAIIVRDSQGRIREISEMEYTNGSRALIVDVSPIKIRSLNE